MLARALGAEAVLYPFRSRASFDSAQIDTYAPIGLALDVGRMQRYWAARGLVLHAVRRALPGAGRGGLSGNYL